MPETPRHAVGDLVDRWTPTGGEPGVVSRVLPGVAGPPVYQVMTGVGRQHVDAERYLRPRQAR